MAEQPQHESKHSDCDGNAALNEMLVELKNSDNGMENADEGLAEEVQVTAVRATKRRPKKKADNAVLYNKSLGTFVCSLCDYRSPKRSNVVRHMKLKVHNPDLPKKYISSDCSRGPFVCDVCKYKALTTANLQRHKTLKHNFYESCAIHDSKQKTLGADKDDGRMEPLKCDRCDYESSGSDLLQQHYRANHRLQTSNVSSLRGNEIEADCQPFKVDTSTLLS